MIYRKRDVAKGFYRVSLLTLFGRVLGLVEDFFKAQLFGASAFSDAFFVCFRIPNFLRKIFADGATSAMLVPSITKLLKTNEKDRISRLISLSIVVLEFFLVIFAFAIILWPAKILSLVAPGFDAERLAIGKTILPVIFPFIILVSTCSIFSAALKSVNHFVSTALGPIIFHIVMIVASILSLRNGWGVVGLAYGVLIGGIAKLCFRFMAYLYFGFSLKLFNRQSWVDFGPVFLRAVPLFLGLGFVEISMMAETIIGSYLPTGEMSLLHYAYRLFNTPLNSIAVPMGATMIPLYSREAAESKSRLEFQLFNTSKFLCWIGLPSLFFLVFGSFVYLDFLLGAKEPVSIVASGAITLSILSMQLISCLLNRNLFNIFYALEDTMTPSIASAIFITLSIFFNRIAMHFFGLYGIAFTCALCPLMATPYLLYQLQTKHCVSLLTPKFKKFLHALLWQCLTIVLPMGLGFSALAIGFRLFMGSYFWVRLASLCLLALGYYLTLLILKRHQNRFCRVPFIRHFKLG